MKTETKKERKTPSKAGAASKTALKRSEAKFREPGQGSKYVVKVTPDYFKEKR